jgi:hypothetical protein
MINYVEAYLSTQQSPPGKNTWLSRSNGQQEWSFSSEKTPRKGAQTPHAVALLIVANVFV